MSRDKVTGREREKDAAEAWLAKNDPDYSKQKRNWQTPSTDAIARDRNIHPTLEHLIPLEPRDNGNYHKRRAAAHEERPFEYSDTGGDQDDG